MAGEARCIRACYAELHDTLRQRVRQIADKHAAELAEPEVHAGPWLFGGADWPLKESFVKEALLEKGALRKGSAAWRQEIGNKVKPYPSHHPQYFPGVYRQDTCCGDSWSVCGDDVPVGYLTWAGWFLKDLALVVAAANRRSTTPLLMLSCGETFVCVQCTYFLKKPFSA